MYWCLIIKSKSHLLLILFFVCFCFNNGLYMEQVPRISEKVEDISRINEKELNQTPELSSNGVEFSSYNLSVIFNPSTSSVSGNLTVNYYNNDPVDFEQIPFHLFLSGMQYVSREGDIDILNVTTVSEPKTPLNFTVDEQAQLLWVNLSTTLNPYESISFEIEFHSIIPDGGLDRANSHGEGNNTIFKFTSFYPMPCVYDEFDGWNTDPYLDVGDPFYHDMAYYDLIIEAPKNITIAATGELIDKINKEATIVHHFSPRSVENFDPLPVREVTFAASEGYKNEWEIINDVNVSTYYIPNSEEMWENNALDYSVAAFNLFNDTFGFYPYSTLNIVEEYALYLGMEYPLQVYASEIIDNYEYSTAVKKQILEKVIVHEIAHQWWYNLVGFDEIDWGFLDEGLTCWSTDYYAEIIHGNWEYFQWTKYYDRVRTYYADEYLPSKINQSAYDLIATSLDWVYISYYKSPLIFEKICRTLGESNFLIGLSNFFEQYKFEIALLSNLQDVFEAFIGSSLDWLFFPWFDNDYIPNYRFTKCGYDENTNKLTVIIADQNETINDYLYSQQVMLYVYDSGDSIIYSDYVWINSTTTIVIPLVDIPYNVRLEYGQDVIAQLGDENITYIESLVDVEEEKGKIFGFDVSLLLIFFVVPLIYLIYKLKIKQKRNSKN
ncbi:MAG: hypothetical protein CEE43_13255 [Promethearchaeota archaeon Loki_b32]|nr:MAG: hypothetical protein CEE43_13255 [Candidatus Lokiarchaeota archaeon Loki_b32]